MEDCSTATRNKQEQKERSITAGHANQAHAQGCEPWCDNNEIPDIEFIRQAPEVRVCKGWYLDDGGQEPCLSQIERQFFYQQRQQGGKETGIHIMDKVTKREQQDFGKLKGGGNKVR